MWVIALRHAFLAGHAQGAIALVVDLTKQAHEILISR
jgi:hypothetical protein